jgi:hypothetical protein
MFFVSLTTHKAQDTITFDASLLDVRRAHTRENEERKANDAHIRTSYIIAQQASSNSIGGSKSKSSSWSSVLLLASAHSFFLAFD